MDKILIGFFVGLLCGLVPLILGLIAKIRVLGAIGTVLSTLTGILFSVLDKSPFTAIGVAIVFVVILFAKNKNRKKSDEHQDDNDLYMDDD